MKVLASLLMLTLKVTAEARPAEMLKERPVARRLTVKLDGTSSCTELAWHAAHSMNKAARTESTDEAAIVAVVGEAATLKWSIEI